MLDHRSVRPKISFPFLRLNDLLEDRARSSPDSPAFLAPGRSALSYGRLHQHIDEIGRELRAMGIDPEDRLAVLLPNGAELAVAIVCLAANAACAVINPAYAFEELDRYFRDLRPKALVTQAEDDAPACRAATELGVPIIKLVRGSGDEAGVFTLQTNSRVEQSPVPAGPGSVAVLLLTSGTTSRPKIVPLTHANVCTSAYSSVAAIGLTENDRCLNVLPLFHGHGLIATIMTTLAAGASIVCTPGYDAKSFFGWLKDYRATWYSAVPTMHQAILAQARSNPAQAKSCRLRLIRSASAPLPPRVFAELERTFATTVIEFYGMTETASAPIACNPLPPGRRKPGSVGISVGLEVAIMSDSGAILPRTQTGEVVVRGPSVMPCYDGDRAATEAAFTGDWFKTGDRGFFDDDGYLFLVGRTREMINRGGENIAPREVDEVLLEHPAVAEVVTFAVPHTTLGEDIAAAIVLRPHAKATAKDIRHFAAKRLAEFKVPRQLIMLDELPKGPTGKVQRVGLAAKLGFASAAAREAFTAPRTPLENELAGIWAEVLQREQVGIHDDFFALGGDSLLATHVLASIDEAMNLKVDVTGLFDAPTVAEMAKHLEALIQAGQARAPASDITRASRADALPVSPAQERLWELQRALPELPFFNVLYPLRITSPLDVAALERALNEVVRRHEILRTTFVARDRRPIAAIAPELAVPLPVDDLQKLPAKKREQAGHRLISGELLHTFDLECGPLIRARLLRFAKDEHLLLIALHQTVVDGWSLGVLADELATIYDAFAGGRPPSLLPQPLQYADFAAWQRQWRSHPELAAQLSYWRERLAEPLPPMSLAKSRPKRSDDDLRTESRDFELPAKLVAAARAFGQSEGATLFMTLVAALQILMHRYLDQKDLRVATNVANRNRSGTERLIGPLANTVILRTELGGDPASKEVLRRVRATTLAAYAHQDLPFEEVAAVLKDERGFEPAELSQVMILLHNAALRPVAASGKSLVFEEADPTMPMPLVTTTAYQVILVLHEGEGALKGSCIYKPPLFSAGFIDRLLRHYRKVLEQMVAQPDRPVSSLTIAVSRKGK